ncbi:hypothetical protein KFK09_002643 [Dendrobium nobile]|uniref:Uncharacterized protein n=1 Tax=Dendrobium nobile TaxID=94219 RepID=A0A8T3C1W5_DENNO|nr:hypothetical protein KFK09_002643 [Dendrobium nobile]
MVVAAGALLFSLISVLSCEGWNEKEEEEGDVGHGTTLPIAKENKKSEKEFAICDRDPREKPTERRVCGVAE